MKLLDYLTGEAAELAVSQALESKVQDGKSVYFPEQKVAGYFFEKDTWVAFDNRDECCWIEEFDNEDAAKLYVATGLSTYDIEEYMAQGFSFKDILIKEGYEE